MSKSPSFKSQLFVFADKFDDRIDSLFAGKVIIEFDQPNRVRASDNCDVYMINRMLAANGHAKQSARIIINFDKGSKKDAMAYQTAALSYEGFRGFLFDKKASHVALKKFDYVLDCIEALERNRDFLSCFDVGAYIKNIPSVRKSDIDQKTSNMVDCMDDYLSVVRQEGYGKFLSAFTV